MFADRHGLIVWSIEALAGMIWIRNPTLNWENRRTVGLKLTWMCAGSQCSGHRTKRWMHTAHQCKTKNCFREHFDLTEWRSTETCLATIEVYILAVICNRFLIDLYNDDFLSIKRSETSLFCRRSNELEDKWNVKTGQTKEIFQTHRRELEQFIIQIDSRLTARQHHQ